MRSVTIVKGNGEREVFDPQKLKESLIRAHATVFTANDVVAVIANEIQDGMTTTQIYKRAFDLLKKKEKRTAIKYSIRRSILHLGPTGFPFELYIAQLLHAKGYQTKTGQVMRGGCVEHEVDVVAWNTDDLLLIEAKFHNETSLKSDTRTALYVKARFDDLAQGTFTLEGKQRQMTRGLLVTNTKFTNNSKEYARCVGTFDMISWEYPKKGNLYDLIEETKLHPMTCVPALSTHDKQELLNRGIVNCQTLKEKSHILKELGKSDEEIAEVLESVAMVCTTD